MKNTLLVVIFTLIYSTQIHGQNFGSIGTEWYYTENGGGHGPPNSEYVHYKSLVDTLINGKTTHKIVRTYYTNNGDTLLFDPIYVYEFADTVFMYNIQKSKFQTIYIFNALQGDTITLDFPEVLSWTTDSTYRLIIDTIETVMLNGISLKKYKTSSLDEFTFWNDNGCFMDRIGGLDWFFPRANIFPEAGGPIRCYSDNIVDTIFQVYACDYRYIISVDEIANEAKVNVFPIPFTDRLNIQTDYAIEKIELTELTGKILLNTNQLFLDCKNISNGIYILTIYFKSGKMIERKIIKNAR